MSSKQISRNSISQPTLALVLILTALAVYFPVLFYDTIDFDAGKYLTENPIVLRGLTYEGVIWAFTNAYFNWHPLTWLSHMLDVQLFGLNPVGHHFTSLALHLANTFVLFSFLARYTKSKWLSFLAALLFACHPMHVGPVAWLAARKDLLSAFFGFSSIYFFARYSENTEASFYLLSASFFACSLMSKGTLITLPAVLLLLDFWPLNRTSALPLRKLILEILPFVVLALGGMGVNFYAQSSIGAVRSLPILDKLSNVAVSYCDYLGKAFWPVKLSIFYPSRGEIPLLAAAGCALILIILTSFALWQRNRSRPFFVGWAFFLITFVPMVGFVQLGTQAQADRYTYIPYIGLSLALIWPGADFVRRISRDGYLGAVLFVSLSVAFAVVTRFQLQHWQSSEEIYRYSILSTGDNSTLEMNLGAILVRKGEPTEALTHFRRSLDLDPTDWRVHKNIGDILAAEGRTDEALQEYLQVVEHDPENARGYNNIGIVLLRLNRGGEAEQYFRRALAIAPNYFEALSNLAHILENRGEGKEALELYQRALELRPDASEIAQRAAKLKTD